MGIRIRVSLFVALVLAGLTGCGDDGDSAGGLERQDPVPAATLLAQVRPAAGGPQEIDTRLEARLEGEGTGAVAAFVDTPLELNVTGQGDTASGAADLGLLLDAGVLKIEGRHVADGTRSYVQLLDTWYVLPDTAAGVVAAVTPALLERPAALVGEDARIIGTESVDGVECDVVEGRGDPDAVAERLAGVVGVVPVVGGASGLDAPALRGAVEPGTARVWIGREDREVHRVRIDADVDLTATPLGAQGLTRGEVRLDGRAVDADGSVEPELPTAARPLEQLQSQLGGLLPRGRTGG
jgi:hypothetical protein